jgi:hypothetical protein
MAMRALAARWLDRPITLTLERWRDAGRSSANWHRSKSAEEWRAALAKQIKGFRGEAVVRRRHRGRGRLTFYQSYKGAPGERRRLIELCLEPEGWFTFDLLTRHAQPWWRQNRIGAHSYLYKHVVRRLGDNWLAQQQAEDIWLAGDTLATPSSLLSAAGEPRPSRVK